MEGGKIDLHVYANGHQVFDGEDDEWEDASDVIISRSKRNVDEESSKKHHKRKRRHNVKHKREPAPILNLPLIDGVYIGAQLSAQQLELMQRRDETFTLGDGKVITFLV